MKGVRANILGEMYLGETIGETFFRNWISLFQQNSEFLVTTWIFMNWVLIVIKRFDCDQ